MLGDDDKYMTKEEKDSAIGKDPLPALRARLVAEAHAGEDELARLQQEIEDEIADAREFGLASELPSVDELRRDVFAQEIAA